jgi:hypothetical protein
MTPLFFASILTFLFLWPCVRTAWDGHAHSLLHRPIIALGDSADAGRTGIHFIILSRCFHVGPQILSRYGRVHSHLDLCTGSLRRLVAPSSPFCLASLLNVSCTNTCAVDIAYFSCLLEDNTQGKEIELWTLIRVGTTMQQDNIMIVHLVMMTLPTQISPDYHIIGGTGQKYLGSGSTWPAPCSSAIRNSLEIHPPW